jgi:hypothetical protein
VTKFHLKTPTLDSNWRAIILFGRNVASYKFALAKTLIEFSEQDKTQISLSELSEPFSRHICEHLSVSDRQATSASSRYLDQCRAFNSGEIGKDELITTTNKLGFVNVIDAFHNVNRADVGTRFFVDERASGTGIELTDNIFKLREMFQGKNLIHETEARWRLVETAWSLDLSNHLIETDEEAETLYHMAGARRTNVTSSRWALNGYQKGRCFYCYDEISVDPGSDKLADVDHFFPWMLKKHAVLMDVDGIWNLVLACQECNRGERGKFASIPSIRLITRLNKRNNYLIDSHHPLRETLLHQTGATEMEREGFLQRHLDAAVDSIGHIWEPPPKAAATF